jgi:hypothetical protein
MNSTRKLISVAWFVSATAVLTAIGIRFADDVVLDTFCARHLGCLLSYLIYFAIVAMEFWCGYALAKSSLNAKRMLIVVSALLGLWWLVYFLMNPDRSFTNVYLVPIPQVLLAVATIVMASSRRPA